MSIYKFKVKPKGSFSFEGLEYPEEVVMVYESEGFYRNIKPLEFKLSQNSRAVAITAFTLFPLDKGLSPCEVPLLALIVLSPGEAGIIYDYTYLDKEHPIQKSSDYPTIWNYLKIPLKDESRV